MNKKINTFFRYLLSVSLISYPLLSSAAYFGETTQLAQAILNIVNKYLIPIVFSLALLYFFWGLAKYIRDTGEGKEEGRQIMVWGVVALFVMSTIWGLTNYIRTELNITGVNDVKIPTINGGN